MNFAGLDIEHVSAEATVAVLYAQFLPRDEIDGKVMLVKGDFIGIVGNFSSRKFTRSLTHAFRKNPQLPVVKLTVPFNGWIMPAIRLSDHASFWDQGFKAVMITDSAFYRNPHYHLLSDSMEKLDYHFMAELVESLSAFFSSQQ